MSSNARPCRLCACPRWERERDAPFCRHCDHGERAHISAADAEALSSMTQARWDRLNEPERDAMRDLTGLTEGLIGLEGWRVEVVRDSHSGEVARFIVGRSTGWRPCHIELPRRDSSGGMSADHAYRRVTRLYEVAA